MYGERSMNIDQGPEIKDERLKTRMKYQRWKNKRSKHEVERQTVKY